jgi:membrane protein implicated in regulation of membrane protease activity
MEIALALKGLAGLLLNLLWLAAVAAAFVFLTTTFARRVYRGRTRSQRADTDRDVEP